jgi:hypothetical protein
VIGPKRPETWVSPGARRRRELHALRRIVDDRATHWHWQFMEHIIGPEQDYLKAQYAQGMADAYQEVMHALSLMRGFPWA